MVFRDGPAAVARFTDGQFMNGRCTSARFGRERPSFRLAETVSTSGASGPFGWACPAKFAASWNPPARTGVRLT